MLCPFPKKCVFPKYNALPLSEKIRFSQSVMLYPFPKKCVFPKA